MAHKAKAKKGRREAVQEDAPKQEAHLMEFTLEQAQAEPKAKREEKPDMDFTIEQEEPEPTTLESKPVKVKKKKAPAKSKPLTYRETSELKLKQSREGIKNEVMRAWTALKANERKHPIEAKMAALNRFREIAADKRQNIKSLSGFLEPEFKQDFFREINGLLKFEAGAKEISRKAAIGLILETWNTFKDAGTQKKKMRVLTEFREIAKSCGCKLTELPEYFEGKKRKGLAGTLKSLVDLEKQLKPKSKKGSGLKIKDVRFK